jgi:DNA-binding CsgD family transcriptional regulator
MATENSDEYDKEYRNPETLREMYHGEGMSTIEIGEVFDVDPSTINKYMERGGVERRKSYKDPTRPPSHLLDPHGDGVGNSYEKIRTYNDGDREVVLLHRLIAYAHGKLDFEGLCDSDTVVHHKSGHGLDNRPENLEVKSFTDHASDHGDERYGDGEWRDKERMKELLDNHTQSEMAEILGCSKRTVYVWKNKHGLE